MKPIDTSKIEIKGRRVVNESPNVEVLHADNENLKEYVPDLSIDCLIACLSLHIVSDPANMLKESQRVLKPGGRAIYSVWGQKEHSYLFTLIDKVKDHYGLPKSTRRSSWHMNNRD